MEDEDALSAAWSAGRAAWPGIVVARAQFAAFAARLEAGAAARYPADVYLAAACSDGDAAAVAAFDRELTAAGSAAVRSIGGSDAFVDEAMQRVRAHLLVGDGAPPRILDYAARGPLRAWLGIAAVRTALMMRRAQASAREVASEDDWTAGLAAITTQSPELAMVKQQCGAALDRALRAAAGRIEPRLRAVLRMSFVDALPLEQIAAVYAVHRATAARWLRGACEQMFVETRRALASELRLSDGEADRVIALVQSQLELSVSLLLPVELGT